MVSYSPRCLPFGKAGGLHNRRCRWLAVGWTTASPLTPWFRSPLTFAATAFGGAANGIATAGAIGSDTNATGGDVTKAVFKTSGSADVVYCAVGTSGSDINLSSVNIGAGDTVSISALTYEAAP